MKKAIVKTPAADFADKMVTALAKQPSTAKELVRDALDHANEAFKNIAMILEKENLKPAALALVYHTVDKGWAKVTKDLRDAAREALLRKVEEAEDAEINDAETERIIRPTYAGATYKIQRAQYRTKLPEDTKFEAALREKEADPKKYMLQVVSYEVTEEGVTKAIADGLFTEEEVEDMKKLLPVQLKVEKL